MHAWQQPNSPIRFPIFETPATALRGTGNLTVCYTVDYCRSKNEPDSSIYHVYVKLPDCILYLSCQAGFLPGHHHRPGPVPGDSSVEQWATAAHTQRPSPVFRGSASNEVESCCDFPSLDFIDWKQIMAIYMYIIVMMYDVWSFISTIMFDSGFGFTTNIRDKNLKVSGDQ